jgi:hypothetical protein
MKKTLANIALFLVVTVVCLALAEVGLRAFTPFPIHAEKANKIYDTDLGYRLNPGHPSIDERGFRNSRGKPRVVAAIGDSHTYGSGVSPEESWPEQFEKITGVPTYNFGVGSYAVYSYYAAARRALDENYKDIVIALFINNDFKVEGSSCDIDYASSGLWREARDRLDLELPDCRLADNWRTARAPGFVRWFRGRADSAILSAVDYLVVLPLSDLAYRWMGNGSQPRAKAAASQQASGRNGAAGKPARRPASAYFAGRGLKNQVEKFAFTDLQRADVRSGIADFEKMLMDLKRRAADKGSRLGVLLITSKLQVVYENFDDKDIFEQVDKLKMTVINHLKIEKRLTDFMTRAGIPWKSAGPRLYAEIEKSDRDGGWVYPPTSGHPFARGYRVYAEAAADLYKEMTGGQ